ncbi:type VII secretion-associated protein [Mycobacterium hodleri]|uniref:type VII secretion-associated protein n=1 Tax=Mycolicibacterium hodleri TaxID=49897 RepID=UPI0021F3ACA9|nr:type VII secretion-associated protein [Mycolicibacterium hodleri]MCV7131597.1 type VII secretion-associated protein [Mycolicibacterium hodleri]
MSGVVVVVGPKEVVGRGAVDLELATTALESLDDAHALVDDCVVGVDDLWRDLVGSASDGPCKRLLLICPSWWGTRRLARVATAARHWSDDVVVVLRSEVWRTEPVVVELGPELVIVHADGRRHAIARASHPAGIIEAVVAHVDGRPAVTVDAPSGVKLLGADLVRALRLRGADVTLEDDRSLVAAVGGAADARALRRHLTPRTVGVAAAILTAGGLAAAAVGVDGRPADPADAWWLVEGRVAVEVPAAWTVERVTTGPGSARVQVSSPGDRSEVIHVTQSRVPDTETLDSTAAALAAVLVGQPQGTFVDFTAADERAERSVVTYREVRPDRRVDWTVLLDGGVRIAIGCQGTGPAPQDACDRAIRSAHAVERK